MKIRLLRNARIMHQAGEVIDVTDPALVHYLVSTGSAEPVKGDALRTPESATQPETRKKATARKRST